MGDLVQTSLAQQPAPTSVQANQAQELMPISVTVTEMPEALSDVTRPIQLEGTLKADLSFKTSQGTLQLELPAATSQGNTASQLVQKTMGEMLEAGTFQKALLRFTPQRDGMLEATLLLSKEDVTDAIGKAISNEAERSVSSSLSSRADNFIAEGKKLSITLLPKDEGKSLSFLEKTAVDFPKAEEGGKGDLLQIAYGLSKNLRALMKEGASPLEIMTAQMSKSEEGGPQGKEGGMTLQKADPSSPSLLSRDDNTPSHVRAALAEKAGPQDFTVRVAKLLQPGEMPPSKLQDGQILAEVIGKNPTGKTILAAGGDTFLVRNDTPLPAGAQIVLTMEHKGNVEESYPLPLPDNLKLSSMRELVTALAVTDPAAAQSFVQDTLPNPTQNFSGTMLFFLSALQTGKVNDWLGGRNIQSLEASGKKHLVDHVMDDLDNASQTVKDAQVGTWRSYPLPLHAQGDYAMLHLYVHQDESGKEEESSKRKRLAKTRFLITLNMPNLGSLQLDGLSQAKKLDMVIRSDRALAPTLQEELRGIYVRTLDALAMTGNIKFQENAAGWIYFEGQKGPEEGVIA